MSEFLIKGLIIIDNHLNIFAAKDIKKKFGLKNIISGSNAIIFIVLLNLKNKIFHLQIVQNKTYNLLLFDK